MIGISCSNVLFAHFNSAARHPLLSGKVFEKTDGLGHYGVGLTYIHMIGLQLSGAFIKKKLCQDRSLTSPEKSLGKLSQR